MIRVLRAAEHVRMPWKNGGGVTTEIAVYPKRASLETFGWRISMANVASDGPFSQFPGIDRTLAVLDGDGMRLESADRAPVTLTPASDPLTFPADIATSARLTGGPILDLNVMTRRGLFRHGVERLPASGSIAAEGTTLLVCTAGRLQVRNEVLDLHDAAELAPGHRYDVRTQGAGTGYVIQMTATGD